VLGCTENGGRREEKRREEKRREEKRREEKRREQNRTEQNTLAPAENEIPNLSISRKF
jgi:hypothetical protein